MRDIEMSWRKLFKRLWNLWFPIVYEVCPDCRVPLIMEELQNNLDQGKSKCFDCLELERLEDERINKENYEKWQVDQRKIAEHMKCAADINDMYQGMTQNMMHQLYGNSLQNMQQQQGLVSEYDQMMCNILNNIAFK